MTNTSKIVKDNVRRFDDDVRRTGSYAYTAEKLSAQYANKRISDAITACYSFAGKKVLDLGCGDGTYSVEFFDFGVEKLLGIDPAEVAVESANKRAEALGLTGRAQFEVGNIYDLGPQIGDRQFDCVVLRGVLHHLPDPERAVACAAALAPTLIILEPNGYNPVLKMLERFSRYHIEHEERSFLPGTLKKWVVNTGMKVTSAQHLNLVPMFCPDWMAKVCKGMEPIAERIPLVREVGCGQCLIVSQR